VLSFKYDKSGILSIKKGEVILTETVEVKSKKDDGTEAETKTTTKTVS
jgi:hypothetical protein